MKKHVKRLFADCFKHLGVKAVYYNSKREEICKIKALIKHPDVTYSIGRDGELTNQIASIEIRVQDVTSFSIGDYIKVGNKFYKIFEQPLKDPSNMLWKLEGIGERNVS